MKKALGIGVALVLAYFAGTMCNLTDGVNVSKKNKIISLQDSIILYQNNLIHDFARHEWESDGDVPEFDNYSEDSIETMIHKLDSIKRK